MRKKAIKPKKKTKAYWSYSEVVKYLTAKKLITEKEENEFWRWLVDLEGVNNGSFQTLFFGEYVEDDYPLSIPEACKKVMKTFIKEFGEEEAEFYFYW